MISRNYASVKEYGASEEPFFEKTAVVGLIGLLLF
jgi:hypothetical protein